MANAVKTAAVAEIAEAFRSSSAAVLTEYRGLTVAQLKELRRTLAGHATYAVVKNTLTRLAARDAGVPDIEALLEGPSAIAFVSGDPVAVAKGIRDFARTNPLLVVKGGVLEGRAMSADEIRRLADLESREVLLARLAGAMQASLAGAVALVAAPLSQAARLMAALQARAEEDPSILRGGAGTPTGVASAPAEPTSSTDTDQAAAEPAATVSTEQPPPTEPTEPAAAEPIEPAAAEPIATEPIEPAAAEPIATEPPEDPATTSGDAADAAVAADALAREVAAEEADAPVPADLGPDSADEPTAEPPRRS